MAFVVNVQRGVPRSPKSGEPHARLLEVNLLDCRQGKKKEEGISHFSQGVEGGRGALWVLNTQCNVRMMWYRICT